MKTRIIEKQKTICSNTHGIHNYFAWPTVARLQDGSLMAVASGFRTAHIDPFGKVVAVRSYDEGKTWTAPEILLDTPLDDRDGGIMTFGESGVMVTSFNNTHEFMRRKGIKTPYAQAYLDEAEKLDASKYLGSTLLISRDCGKTFDGPYILPVTSPHGPCELNDGRILYVGRVYESFLNVAAYKGGHFLECHIISPDGKSEYLSKIEDVSPDFLSCEPHAIQLKNGRIIVQIRVQELRPKDNRGQYFTIFQSVSDDMGKTFTKPRQLLSDRGGSPPHLIELSNGMLVSVYGYRDEPYGIRAMFSRDGGETWDTDYEIVGGEDSEDLGYPASVELENGNILTVFYSREKGASVIKQVIWSIEE